jgi:hypothetical protein
MVNLEVVVGGSPTSGMYVCDCFLRRMTDASMIVDGTITATKIAAGSITGDMITTGSLTANVIYFSDGFCLNTLEPKEAGSDITRGHILTNKSTVTGFSLPSNGSMGAIGGFGFTTVASGSVDVFNISAVLVFSGGSTTDSITIKVTDTNTSTDYGSITYRLPLSSNVNTFPYFVSITGLGAGSHNFQFYGEKTSSSTITVAGGTYAICQRIF